MRFDITDILTDYPDIHIGVLVNTGLNNKTTYNELFRLQKEALQSAQDQIGDQLPTKHPHISSWRKIYKSFGTRPGDYRPSAEALIRRALKIGKLPRINNVVDIYNLISVKHVIPMGGFDLDHVNGTIRLRKSNGGESFTPLGTIELEETYTGEVVYSDDSHILTRRWNYRDAEKTKITVDTTNLVMFLDASPAIDVDRVEVALDELAYLLGNACGGDMTQAIASRDHPIVNL